MVELKEYPEQGELVLCTVQNIQGTTVFAKLDKYGKTGVIHTSEIAPGRIRNIRDYVVPNKKIVCKVLRLDISKGHIDLSLRRVTRKDTQEIIKQFKKEQVANKILEIVLKDKANQVKEKILEKYENINDLLEESLQDSKILTKFMEEIPLCTSYSTAFRMPQYPMSLPNGLLRALQQQWSMPRGKLIPRLGWTCGLFGAGVIGQSPSRMKVTMRNTK